MTVSAGEWGGLDDAARPFSPPDGALPPRRTAATLIADALRDEIVDLLLLPGAALQEKELTARFGVSRTPVREALLRLAEEGLVAIRPQSGTFVSRIPLATLPEAVIVRQALEGSAVELAAARATVSGVAGLHQTMRRLQELAAANDRIAFHEADESFHEGVAVLAGHPGLWRLVRQTKLQIDRCRRLTMPVLGRMGQVLAEHGEILDAVARGDGPSARAAMVRHLEAVLPDARKLARMHPDFFT